MLGKRLFPLPGRRAEVMLSGVGSVVLAAPSTALSAPSAILEDPHARHPTYPAAKGRHFQAHCGTDAAHPHLLPYTVPGLCPAPGYNRHIGKMKVMLLISISMLKHLPPPIAGNRGEINATIKKAFSLRCFLHRISFLWVYAITC